MAQGGGIQGGGPPGMPGMGGGIQPIDGGTGGICPSAPLSRFRSRSRSRSRSPDFFRFFDLLLFLESEDDESEPDLEEDDFRRFFVFLPSLRRDRLRLLFDLRDLESLFRLPREPTV
mmetsp:Transcript_31710/g.57784  ORF Transcript_31710/g.57784 Transcript_31710/m.57784 type:complete len:117 (-) Transcript_31710:439-789(-)